MTDDDEDDYTPPKVTGSPERIWLNYGDIDRDCTHGECDEVTWCDSSMDQADVEYVRADLAHPPVQPTLSEQFIQDALRLAAEFEMADLEAHLRGGKTVQPTESVAQDAARYRWLRDNQDDETLIAAYAYRSDWTPALVDAAIDAAMGTHPPVQPTDWNEIAQAVIDLFESGSWTPRQQGLWVPVIQRIRALKTGTTMSDEGFISQTDGDGRVSITYPSDKEAPTPTSGNDEVEAMCADLERSAIEIRKAGHAGWGNACSWAAAFILKQAAQIERVESANSSLHAQWDAEVKTLRAQIANLEADLGNERAINEARGKLTEELVAQIAELKNEMLQKATPKSAIAGKEGK